ncbi:hypothetical protein ACTVZO_41340 [Streptomyces sp. IBSNAI002]|uniref:hypothetical protein n=1 Tax=Streptomyces sp. IBSNAI002 TaxID=3457500 RepID=UPI003FCF230E
MTSEVSVNAQPLTAAQADALHIETHTPYLAAHPELLDGLAIAEPSQVWCTAKLPDDVWWRSAAVHEAAHAVLAWVFGLEVKRLTLAGDRTALEGGGCWVTGRGDAQHYTLGWLGAGYAQADWLTDHGYTHPELRRCVLEHGALGDHRIVDGYVASGFVIDRTQAIADAQRVLAEPHTAAALNDLAVLLLAEGQLEAHRINETLLARCVERPVTLAVWVPGQRLPLIAMPQQCCAEVAEARRGSAASRQS